MTRIKSRCLPAGSAGVPECVTHCLLLKIIILLLPVESNILHYNVEPYVFPTLIYYKHKSPSLKEDLQKALLILKYYHHPLIKLAKTQPPVSTSKNNMMKREIFPLLSSFG